MTALQSNHIVSAQPEQAPREAAARLFVPRCPQSLFLTTFQLSLQPGARLPQRASAGRLHMCLSVLLTRSEARAAPARAENALTQLDPEKGLLQPLSATASQPVDQGD
jgi:hypothetical protein